MGLGRHMGRNGQGWRTGLALCCSMILVSGCGKGEYERRLEKRTNELRSAPQKKADQPNVPGVPAEQGGGAAEGAPADQPPGDAGAEAAPAG